MTVEQRGGVNAIGIAIVAAASIAFVYGMTERPRPQLQVDYGKPIADMREEIGTLKAKVQTNENKIEHVGTSVVGAKNDLADQVVGAKAYAEEKAKQAAEALNKRLEAMAGMTAAVDELKGKVDGDLGTMRENLGTIEEKIGTIKPELETVAKAAGTATEKAETNAERLAELQKEIDALRAELKAAAALAAEAKAQALEKPVGAAPPAETGPEELADRLLFVTAPWCVYCPKAFEYAPEIKAAGLTWGTSPLNNIETVELNTDKGKRYARRYMFPEKMSLPAWVRVVDGKAELYTFGLIGAKNVIEFARRTVRKTAITVGAMFAPCLG